MATQADLDALEKAINSGRLSVQYADNKVTYRSLEDMQAIARKLRRELGLEKSGWNYDTVRYGKGIQ